MIDSVKAAEAVCGPLSFTDKMPCASYNLPADACKAGSKLRHVKGSVCSKCYARRNRYTFPSVRTSLWRHYASLEHPDWAEAMAFLINRQPVKFFRFHDSGDIADREHLDAMVEVALRCPGVGFWVPTLEVKTIKDRFGPGRRRMPSNMNVRISTAMVGERPYKHVEELRRGEPGVSMSMVSKEPGEDCFKCPATWTKSKVCGECRACWSRDVSIVCYKPH